MADLVKSWRVKQGGLMRCCLATLSEHMESAVGLPTEGEILHCKYHRDNGGMIFRDGWWKWNRPNESLPVKFSPPNPQEAP